MSPIPAKEAGLKHNHSLGRGSQNLAASLCDHHHVFDPHSKLSRDVYARFDGDDHPRVQDFFLSGRYAWWFMNFQAHSVTSRMRKITVQITLFQQFPGRLIYFASGYARLHSLDCGLLRLPDSFVYPAGFACRTTHMHCAGHVRTITSEYNTEVTDHESAAWNGGLRSPTVR